MSSNHPHLIPSVLFATTTLIVAGIDSSGSKSSSAGLFNHSTIGSPFASITTARGSTINHAGMIEILYPVNPSSISDLDEDGLPDGWELRYFGTNGADATADSDHDGSNNLMEYLAGTHPSNSSSVFRLEISHIGGIFQIPIPTLSGRSYQVWASNDLLSWTLQSTLVGDDTEQLFQFDGTTVADSPSPPQASSAFFRVKILIP